MVCGAGMLRVRTEVRMKETERRATEAGLERGVVPGSPILIFENGFHSHLSIIETIETKMLHTCTEGRRN